MVSRIALVQRILNGLRKAFIVASIHHRRNIRYNRWYEALCFGTITFTWGYMVGELLFTFKKKGFIRQQLSEPTDFQRVFIDAQQPHGVIKTETVNEEVFDKANIYGKKLNSFEWYALQPSIEKSPFIKYHLNQMISLKQN